MSRRTEIMKPILLSINDIDFKLINNDVIKIGKKKFVRVKIK